MPVRSMLAAMALIVATTAAATAQTPVERHGALQVRDGRITDKDGKPVILRGMSLFWSQWKPRYYSAATISWLRKDWNINLLRVAVGVDYGGYRDHPQRELAKAYRAIDAAVANGLYVLVDWHAHQPHPQEAAEFFEKIARRYGTLPNIIYEPYNEPLDTIDWSTVIKPYHETVIARIRRIDPDNLIVAGTQSWSQDVDKAAADPIADPNLAYTLHFYAGSHKAWLRAKAVTAMRLGAALFVTEWGTAGASGNDHYDPAETRLWWDFMERNGISQANWSVADKDETTSILRPGAPAAHWTDAMISTSGLLVRHHLRCANPRADTARWFAEECTPGTTAMHRPADQ
jgi:endoglucanase